MDLSLRSLWQNREASNRSPRTPVTPETGRLGITLGTFSSRTPVIRINANSWTTEPLRSRPTGPRQQQAKAMAEQHGIDLSFEPFGTPHQAVAPGTDPMSAFTTVESTTVMAEE